MNFEDIIHALLAPCTQQVPFYDPVSSAAATVYRKPIVERGMEGTRLCNKHMVCCTVLPFQLHRQCMLVRWFVSLV
jgi:hypothetical protein